MSRAIAVSEMSTVLAAEIVHLHAYICVYLSLKDTRNNVKIHEDVFRCIMF